LKSPVKIQRYIRFFNRFEGFRMERTMLRHAAKGQKKLRTGLCAVPAELKEALQITRSAQVTAITGPPRRKKPETSTIWITRKNLDPAT
jgi:hypothetical protein